jgi:signal transduction histidine kinase
MPVHELDRDQFRQVLVNLVQNASEAYEEGAAGNVTVGAAQTEAGNWTLSVSDSASGMTPEVLARVFQPLFSTKVKGTGLGLAVVSNMIERHGAELKVASTPGAGTTFTIVLPPAVASDCAAE